MYHITDKYISLFEHSFLVLCVLTMVVHIIATNTKRKILPNLKGKGYLIFKILNNKMCVRSSTSQCHALLEFGLWELRGIIGS